MGRLIAVVIAAGFVTGCQTYRGSKVTAYLGGGLVVGGLAIGANGEGGDARDGAVTLVASGVVVAVLGIAGMVVWGAAETITSPPQQTMPVMAPMAPPPFDPNGQQMTDDDRRRRSAWDLTQQARTAAHANDCPRVAYLAQRVIELDRSTFDTVFSRDPYIVKCTPKPPQPPPDPPRRIPIPPLDPTPPPDPPATP